MSAGSTAHAALFERSTTNLQDEAQAAARDGKLLAIDIDFTIDGGAYATLSSVVLSRGTIHAAGPYSCANVRIRSRAVATNAPPHGAFRGFGEAFLAILREG